MIDLAFICPTAYLEKYSKQGGFYLALAHLIDDEGKNEYTTFHRREAEKGRRIILDNGLFEGAQVDTQTLLHRARLINAQVVCAPDVLYDAQGTIKEFKSFIRAKQEAGMVIDVMGIPQADNPADWWDCFRFMDLSPHCNLIGLSILSIPKAFDDAAGERKEHITGARMYLLRQLFAYENLVGRRATPCHLLGLGESLSDIILANRILSETVVSNDSSSAFVHGWKGITYSALGRIPGGKDHEKLNFDMPARHQIALDVLGDPIQKNINIAKELATYNWRPVYAST